jgi:hypothetical protein
LMWVNGWHVPCLELQWRWTSSHWWSDALLEAAVNGQVARTVTGSLHMMVNLHTACWCLVRSSVTPEVFAVRLPCYSWAKLCKMQYLSVLAADCLCSFIHGNNQNDTGSFFFLSIDADSY